MSTPPSEHFIMFVIILSSILFSVFFLGKIYKQWNVQILSVPFDEFW